MSGEKKLFLSPTYRIYQPVDLDKKWFVYWKEGGKRQRKYGNINTAQTYAGRMERARALIEQLKKERRRPVSVAEQMVRDFLIRNQGLWSAKTRATYDTVTDIFFEYLGGYEPTPELALAFLQHLHTTRHGSTYNKYRAILKRLFDGVGAAYLFADTQPVKANPTPARYFQTYQARRLGKVIQERDKGLWLFVQLMYYCFLRPKELRLLRAGDFLLDDREVRVPGEVSKNRKTQFVAIPDVFFPQVAFLYDTDPGQLLFPSPADPEQYIGKSTMYRRHLRILNELNFGQGYTLYSWKHTGAVAAAKAGVSLKELQLQLRHHSLDETDGYLRQMGIRDVQRLRHIFPGIGEKLQRTTGRRL